MGKYLFGAQFQVSNYHYGEFKAAFKQLATAHPSWDKENELEHGWQGSVFFSILIQSRIPCSENSLTHSWWVFSSRLTQTRKFLAGIPAGQLDLTSASVRLSPLGDSVLR